MSCENIFNKKRIIFFVLVLNLVLSLPVNLKAYIPAIKGLYTVFSPDTIGIGQVLKSKGWIENVYDNADKNNLAKIVISRFYHKISENESLKITAIAPVCELTPELFGRIINYTRQYRLADAEKRVSMIEEGKKIVGDWYKQCDGYIKNQLSGYTKNRISREIIVKENKFVKNTKKLNELKSKESELENNKIKIKKELIELRAKVKADKKNTQLFEQFKNKEEEQRNCIEKLNEIRQVESEQRNYQKDIQKLKNLQNDEELFKTEVKNDDKKILDNTSKILTELENLAKSQDFIPETAEAILWAFFEDKFTLGDYKKSFENLLICLTQIEGKKIERVKKLEFYGAQEYEQFKKEIVELAYKGLITLDYKKIDKIVNDYDRSNHANIKISRIQIVPKAIVASQMSYEDIDDKKTEYFATCFEAAMLDTLSILLYNPKTKIYDTNLLPENTRQSEFFKNIIDKVFSDSSSQEEEKSGLIDPQKINSNYQQWINLIENRKSDLGIEYWSPKGSRDKDNYYNLYTTFENLIKILSATFNLGLDITADPENPGTLEINNFNIVVKEIDSNLKAKDFYDNLFTFISKKLSTKERAIKFSCNLKTEPASFTISGNTIKINSSYGTIHTKIEYQDSSLLQYNTEFDLQINPGHAYTTCKARDLKGLGDLYDVNFENLIKEKLANLDNKLLTTYILLMNTNMVKKSTLPLENLMFYCMPQKNDEQKVTILKLALIYDLFGDIGFESVKGKFINSLDNSNTLNLLDYIFESDKDLFNWVSIVEKLTNKITDPNQAEVAITEILFLKKDISGLINVVEKLVNKIENGEFIIKKIFNLKKDIPSLIKLVKKLDEKITNVEDKFLLMRLIIGSAKDINMFKDILEKLCNELAENGFVSKTIWTILSLAKNINDFDLILSNLFDKITDSKDAASAIRAITESNKDLSGFIHRIEKLADKITESSSAAFAIRAITKSNKDISSLINTLKKLADKITESSSAEIVIRAITKSNKDISSLIDVVKKMVDKIIYSKNAERVIRTITKSNKDISDLIDVVKKMADKIIDPEDAKRVIITIMDSNKDISDLIDVVKKMADKIIDPEDAEEVISTIINSNKDISSLINVLEKMADKIIDPEDVEKVISKIINSNKDISDLINVLEKMADKTTESYALKLIERILFSNKNLSSLIRIVEKLADKIVGPDFAKKAIIVILSSNKDISGLINVAEKLADKTIDDYSGLQTPLIDTILLLNKNISSCIRIVEKLADKITSPDSVQKLISTIINSNKDMSYFINLLEKFTDKITESRYASGVITIILSSKKNIKNFELILKNLFDKITDSYDALAAIEAILSSNKDISSLMPAIEKLVDKVSDSYCASWIIKGILKYKHKISNADKIIEKLSEKIVRTFDAQEIEKELEESGYRPANIGKIMENLEKANQSLW